MTAGLLVASAVLAGRAVAAEEEVMTVRAEARAEGTGFTAKTRAVEMAEQDAILQVLASLAPMVDTRLVSPILESATKYIDSYDLLRHDVIGENTKVELDAHIAARALRQDLAAIVLPRLPEPPGVVLLMGEQLVGDKIIAVPDSGIGEVALREKLRKMGLKVTSSSELAESYDQADFITVVNGKLEAGAEFAQENLCDTAIVGTAICEAEPSGTNVTRVRATVTLRIFRGVDGKMMDEVVSHAAIAGADTVAASEEAIRDACTKVQGDATIAAVMTALGAVGKDRIHLMIPKPGKRDAADGVLAKLKGEELVTDLTQPYYSEKMYRVSMHYDGPMSYLVNLISQGKYAGRALEVERVVNRVIVGKFE